MIDRTRGVLAAIKYLKDKGKINRVDINYYIRDMKILAREFLFEYNLRKKL